jgi:hypothetical protein
VFESQGLHGFTFILRFLHWAHPKRDLTWKRRDGMLASLGESHVPIKILSRLPVPDALKKSRDLAQL